jgi:hypothetical protein
MSVYIAAPPKGKAPIDLSGEATTFTRKQVDARHPEYISNQEVWFNVGVLYEGGSAIKQHAERFLKQRPKEDATVFQHRQDQFSYENNIGTGLGWHEAQMFATDPQVDIKVSDADGNATESPLSPDQQSFYDRFMKDCDRHGTTFVDMYRKVFTNLLLYRRSFVMIDLPSRDPNQPVENLQQEQDLRLLDPYLCVCSPLDIINWDTDEYGNLMWAVLYSKTVQQRFGKKPLTVERWYFYDRQQYRVYEAQTEQGTSVVGTGELNNAPVELTRAGYHSLATLNMVPLQKIEVPAGWWMANRVYLPAMEHVNISNALKWSLFMAALAVPVLCTARDVSSLTMTETGFIQLDPEDKYMFAEPNGTSWQHLADRAHVLKEEIWRGMHLVSQSRTTSATASAQSGVSKQQDMQPSHDVLNGLGDILRAAMQNTLKYVAAARAMVPGKESDKTLTFDVRGFTFEDKLSTDEISVIQDLVTLDIPSDTFEKELYMLAIDSALKDLNPETRTKIKEEIIAAPNRADRALQQQQKEADMMRDKMNASMSADDPEGTV